MRRHQEYSLNSLTPRRVNSSLRPHSSGVMRNTSLLSFLTSINSKNLAYVRSATQYIRKRRETGDDRSNDHRYLWRDGRPEPKETPPRAFSIVLCRVSSGGIAHCGVLAP